MASTLSIVFKMTKDPDAWFDRPVPARWKRSLVEWRWHCHQMQNSEEWADLRAKRYKLEQASSDLARMRQGKADETKGTAVVPGVSKKGRGSK